MNNLPAIRSGKELAIITAKELPKYLTYDEVQRVLAGIDNPRDHFLCNFLWQTGVRITEALGVKGTDLDHRAEVLQVYTLKRKKKPIRIIPIQAPLLKDLAFYLLKEGKRTEDNLFDFTRQRAYQIVNGAIKAAGIEREKAKPHAFRHSFAINCLLNQVPVTVLQKWLGHSNIQNTLVYLQILGMDTRAFMAGVQF